MFTNLLTSSDNTDGSDHDESEEDEITADGEGANKGFFKKLGSLIYEG